MSTETALIVIGGCTGSGKTTLSSRLSAELCLPCLHEDVLKRTLCASMGFTRPLAGRGETYARIRQSAHDIMFCLARENLLSGVSTLLDITMSRASQWRQVEGILAIHPEALFVPLVLRCSREVSLSRIRQRYKQLPDGYDPPEILWTDPGKLEHWEYLQRLDRPDVHWIDANRPFEQVYAQAKTSLLALWRNQP